MQNQGSVWANIGTYSSEGHAIQQAQNKLNGGAFAVRVVDANDNIVWSG